MAPLLLVGVLAASAGEGPIVYKTRRDLDYEGLKLSGPLLKPPINVCPLVRPRGPGGILPPDLTLRQDFNEEISDSVQIVAPDLAEAASL